MKFKNREDILKNIDIIKEKLSSNGYTIGKRLGNDFFNLWSCL